MALLPDVGIWALLGTHLPLHWTSPKPDALSGGCSGKIYTDEKSQPPNSFFKEAKQIWWFILCHSDPSICSTSGKWDGRDGSANIKLKEALSGCPMNSWFLFKATKSLITLSKKLRLSCKMLLECCQQKMLFLHDHSTHAHTSLGSCCFLIFFLPVCRLSLFSFGSESLPACLSLCLLPFFPLLIPSSLFLSLWLLFLVPEAQSSLPHTAWGFLWMPWSRAQPNLLLQLCLWSLTESLFSPSQPAPCLLLNIQMVAEHLVPSVLLDPRKGVVGHVMSSCNLGGHLEERRHYSDSSLLLQWPLWMEPCRWTEGRKQRRKERRTVLFYSYIHSRSIY